MMFLKVDLCLAYVKSSKAIGARLMPIHNFDGYDFEGMPISSGTDVDIEIARNKCISEAIERSVFRAVCVNKSNFHGFENLSSSMGFAVSPVEKDARENSIMEAAEGRIRNQIWQSEVSLESLPQNLLEASNYRDLMSAYKNILGFQREVVVSSFGKEVQKSNFVVIQGADDSGQFCQGYGLKNTLEKSIDHAIIELWRNIRIRSHLAGLQSERSEIQEVINSKDLREAVSVQSLKENISPLILDVCSVVEIKTNLSEAKCFYSRVSP